MLKTAGRRAVGNVLRGVASDIQLRITMWKEIRVSVSGEEGETTLSLVDDKEGIETDDCESGGRRDDDDNMNSSSVRRSINT
ncbi:hypothetical protein F2Q69_00055422 [Brassica cretica]|uniref:Uncharacterized protein n=2 Tax=Brassica cretica TaxID=69181 RepID=A0ABQ7E0Z2_BRACR|nr:hypothetical protein F2Q69_00055422 [Brassica cretica]KAF3590928.1 hypothetical protein DY000_02024655 [Brassica cretica]